MPRKNLLLLQGKPLVTHTIEHARLASLVTKVVVSTDDPEIASTAEAAGAQAILRPSELASDTATSESALSHALQILDQQEHFIPDVVLFLQCTSPVRKPSDVDNAVTALITAGADSLVSVVRWPRFVWSLLNGVAAPMNYDPVHRPRTQDMEGQFLENGSIYAFRPWVLRQYNSRLGGKIGIYEMDFWSSFEIDTLEDLEICRWILEKQAGHDRAKALPHPVHAVFFDFDGVFTNNMVLTLQDGAEGILADRRDGYGIGLLRAAGVFAGVLSTERNPVVAARCAKMGIPLHQGLDNKLQTLVRLAEANKLDLKHVIYVGNDLNDLECIQSAGCGIAVADAHPSVRAAARVVLQHEGGYGAVREVCELVLSGVRSATHQ